VSSSSSSTTGTLLTPRAPCVLLPRSFSYTASEMMTLSQATPFDYGSGVVNPKAALAVWKTSLK
jgi:hypothetical protein